MWRHAVLALCATIAHAMRDSHSIAAAPSRLLSRLSSYEVVHMSTSNTFKTAANGDVLHPSTSDFHFEAYKQVFRGGLKKNTELFGAGYTEERRQYSRTGTEPEAAAVLEGSEASRLSAERLCHYVGNTDVAPYARLALSSCFGGWNGLMVLEGEVFGIHPAREHLPMSMLEPHIMGAQAFGATARASTMYLVYRLADMKPEGAGPTCYHGVHPLDDAKHDHHHHDGEREHGTQRRAAEEAWDHHAVWAPAERFDVTRGRHHVDTEAVAVRTVEFLVVNDKARYDLISGTNSARYATEDDTASVVNGVALLWTDTKITTPVKIVLIGQVTFTTADPYTALNYGVREKNVSSLLTQFHAWRSTAGNTPAHDNGHLFSGFDFQDTVLGYAGTSVMCIRTLSGGIDQAFTPDFGVAKVAAIVAHEVGHNFGMRHDSEGNTCAASGFIMNAILNQTGTEFSTCSAAYYQAWQQQFDSSCLDNEATRVWGQAVCGDGYIQDGEDCDCGKDSCVGVDPCCLGAADPVAPCRFASAASCSNSDPCCFNCQLATAGNKTVCRAARGTCDVEEYCNGMSSTCPEDRVKGAGTACTSTIDGDGLCFEGQCASWSWDCRVTNQLDSNAPWTTCSSAQQPDGTDDFCSALTCFSASLNQCNQWRQRVGDQLVLVKPSDGVPCGNEMQCQAGQCKASKDLNPGIFWVAGLWSSCDSCDDFQTRQVDCKMQLETQLLTVDNSICTPSQRPISTQPCQNPALDPPCVHSTQSKATAWARSIANKYNVLDKMGSLRNGWARFGPRQFSATNPAYKRGIYLMSFYGFFFAFLFILAWCVHTFCHHKHDLCVKSHHKLDVHLKPKWLMFFFMVVLLGFAVSFAMAAMYYNGELTRGAQDKTTGALPLMTRMVEDTLSLTAILSVPMHYINSSTLPIITSVEPKYTVALAVTQGGMTPVLTSLDTVSTVLPASLSVNGYDTAGGETYVSSWNSNKNQLVTSAKTEVSGSAANTFMNTVNSAIDHQSNVIANLKYRLLFTNKDLMNETLSKLDYVNRTALKNHDLAQNWESRARTANKVRYPFTMLFLFVPFISVVLVLAAAFLEMAKHHAPKMLSINWHLMYFNMLILMILFAIHLPLATVTGDSCDYLDKAELDVSGTLGISKHAGAILESCLADPSTGANVVAAMNMSEFMSYVTLLNFTQPNPNWASLFVFPSLTTLDNNVQQQTTAIYTLNGQTATQRVDSLLTELSQTTDGDGVQRTYTRTNVQQTWNYGPNQQSLRAQCIVSITAESSINLTITNTKKASTDVLSKARAMQSNTLQALTEIYTRTSEDKSAQTQLKPLIDAGQVVLDNSHCFHLGAEYKQFKSSWCQTIAGAFAFLSLAFFLIATFSAPVVYMSMILMTWMDPVLHPDHPDFPGTHEDHPAHPKNPAYKKTEDGEDLDRNNENDALWNGSRDNDRPPSSLARKAIANRKQQAAVSQPLPEAPPPFNPEAAWMMTPPPPTAAETAWMNAGPANTNGTTNGNTNGTGSGTYNGFDDAEQPGGGW